MHPTEAPAAAVSRFRAAWKGINTNSSEPLDAAARQVIVNLKGEIEMTVGALPDEEMGQLPELQDLHRELEAVLESGGGQS